MTGFLAHLNRHMGPDLGHLTYTTLAGFVAFEFLGLAAAITTVVGIGVGKEVIQGIRGIQQGNFKILDTIADLASHLAAMAYQYFVAGDLSGVFISAGILLPIYFGARRIEYETL